MTPARERRTSREVDCRGMRCPLPVIHARKQLALMAIGEVLKVIATDPGSVDDIAEFSRHSRTELMAQSEDGGDYVFLLRKRFGVAIIAGAVACIDTEASLKRKGDAHGCEPRETE